MSPYKLQTISIRKEYPGTLALDDVSVGFEAGKVHALLGKNGAGKSTLVKVLAGTVQPTSGQILIDGRPVVLRSARDAFDHGIACVYQEMSLIPGLTVAENILLGRLPRRRFLGGSIIDWSETFGLAQAHLDSMCARVQARQKVSQLGMAQQQIVEIAKAMSFRPGVLMLDEPTSALAQHETQILFELVRNLAARGVAVLYITHRLQELCHVADTVTVLRDGRLIGREDMARATPRTIVQMMFGEVVRKERPSGLRAGDRVVMDVRGLSRRGVLHDVNFQLRQGEILGIAGMLGSGRTELLRALFGADPFDQGEIVLEGRRVSRGDPAKMKSLGLAFTPENRKEQGLVQTLSIRENVCLASLDRIAAGGVTTRRRERAVVGPLLEALGIRVPHLEAPVASLSGGNQQKVVVGKWLNTQPRVILFDEPTRGIDVQAKQQIFQIMWDLSGRGISSVFVSSELEELIEVCHRILIMKKGTILGEVRPDDTSVDDLFVRCMERD